MLRWILNLWYTRLRRLDVDILWPSCIELSSDIDHARAAFAMHAFQDRAWLILGVEEIIKQIDDLLELTQ